MTPTDVDVLAKFLGAVPNFGAAMLIIYGGMKRWFVWGWLYDQMKSERDEAILIAREGMQSAHRANVTTEKAIRGAR